MRTGSGRYIPFLALFLVVFSDISSVVSTARWNYRKFRTHSLSTQLITNFVIGLTNPLLLYVRTPIGCISFNLGTRL
ncbi:hypothetical protein F5Y18DRAFT_376614 [Xylariaceae sp. FL1019]|nr:hypothetical protein F5Y18DRAFT_376614 [Xylariaceae sp. FL1019]